VKFSKFPESRILIVLLQRYLKKIDYRENYMSTNNSVRSVLITGASSGIGEASAIELDKLGFQVFAGVRNEQAAEKLHSKASERLMPVMIDVSDAASIKSAAELIKEKTGERGLFGLINNAGIAIAGPLEILPIEYLRRQFEVNVIGHIAVTQAMLPILRIAKGRIVFTSSVSGAVSSPYLAPYAASKWAIEALADALRLELRTWDISVSLLEPGPIATPIWERSVNTADKMSNTLSSDALELYDLDLIAIRKTIANSSKNASPVETVVQAVVHAMTAQKPRIRYFLRFMNRVLFRSFKLLPDPIKDCFVRIACGLR
jgi:NAD(P)-dependent dehydrogenase (short-subunit alcohol dehydrogenase family)